MAEPTPSVLRAEAATRAYPPPEGGEPRAVLGPLDLKVGAGEFLVIVGPSGCGKSTLLHLLAGLDLPTEGEITFRDAPLDGPGPQLGVVFQQYTTLPWLTVQDNVALGLRWRGVPRKERHSEAQRLLRMVGLDGSERAWPNTLSGGMRQRVAIARALATQPAVLLMDEPFGALDAQTRSHMQVQLLETWRQTGCAVIFVTHDIDEAVFLGDRVVVLSPCPGRIFAEHIIGVERPRTLEAREQGSFADHRSAVAHSLEQAVLAAVRR